MPSEMGSVPARPKVGIVNGLPDTVEMLELTLEHAGFETVSVLARDVRQGRVDLPALTRTHGLRAIVYDLAIPYHDNWEFLQEVQREHASELPPIVLTTTNIRGIQEYAGDARIIEILGKPYELLQLVEAVQSAVRAGRDRE